MEEKFHLGVIQNDIGVQLDTLPLIFLLNLQMFVFDYVYFQHTRSTQSLKQLLYVIVFAIARIFHLIKLRENLLQVLELRLIGKLDLLGSFAIPIQTSLFSSKFLSRALVFAHNYLATLKTPLILDKDRVDKVWNRLLLLVYLLHQRH